MVPPLYLLQSWLLWGSKQVRKKGKAASAASRDTMERLLRSPKLGPSHVAHSRALSSLLTQRKKTGKAPDFISIHENKEKMHRD